MGNANAPLKRSAWAQGLMEISASRKESIGTLRLTMDGRKFRYSRAGSTTLAAGKMTIAALPNAQTINVSVVAAAIGAYNVQLTSLTWAVDIAENQYQGGFLQVNDGTGEAIQYPIVSNSAFVTGDTTIDVTLGAPIKVALVASATTEVSLIPNPWYGTAISEVEESFCTGIPPVAVTANYYYWSQTGGIAIAFCHGTPAVNSMMVLSSMPPGALRVMPGTLDVDQAVVARMYATVGVSGEYKPVQLLID